MIVVIFCVCPIYFDLRIFGSAFVFVGKKCSFTWNSNHRIEWCECWTRRGRRRNFFWVKIELDHGGIEHVDDQAIFPSKNLKTMLLEALLKYFTEPTSFFKRVIRKYFTVPTTSFFSYTLFESSLPLIIPCTFNYAFIYAKQEYPRLGYVKIL